MPQQRIGEIVAGQQSKNTTTMLRKLLPVTFVVAAGLSIPSIASASLHADLSALAFILIPFLVLKEGAPLAMLGAAYIFWRKQRNGWLFACVVATVALSLLSRILVFVYTTFSATGYGSTVFTYMPVVYATMDWILLIVALASKRRNTPSIPTA